MPARAHAKSKHARAPRLAASPTLREASFLLLFLLLTAAMTWPWVTRLRDAVANVGDPYMIAWTLWWDYHATFNGPLNLFHANVFYPHPYSLAFSEHDYGIALLFFPLFAAGFRPLTVHSFATFCGFAFCGYASFRLTRTLTGSAAAGLVAGVFFAFVPYRFTLLEHLHYLFAGWLPLLLEALVLFARRRSWRRAAWLGVAFVMNALTCVTWMVLALVPLALSLLFLVVRYRLARDREFWLRGGVAMMCASLVLLPFLLPYYHVRRLYGFTWTRQDAVGNSPTLASWLNAEQRNKLWRGFGSRLGGTAPLFPGLLPLVLALAGLLYNSRRRASGAEDSAHTSRDDRPDARAESFNASAGRFDARVKRIVVALDALVVATLVYMLMAAGYAGSDDWRAAFFGFLDADHVLPVITAALAARLCLAYPRWLRAGARNLCETIRAARGGDALWLGSLWAAVGFLMSLGMNSLFYRLVYDNFFLFRTQRVPARGAMLAYVGLAVLAGAGAARLAHALASGSSARRRAFTTYAVLALALLFELRGAPLRFERGAVYPDELTLRLKETPMRGGLLELP
ncbi:MAG TPA: hypothetical protein VGV38_03610, partial [Pyrinomonadaceae bacterium]|nr:hypothetical protein [Pyrinomonadaceae bacterium]